MSTYTQILYQIVFSTKDRKPSMISDGEGRKRLYHYIWNTLKNKDCHLYRINGVEDHIHILTSLHATIPLSNLIKDIKISSSGFIKENNIFPHFDNWQKGYGAFTYNIKEKDILIEYIKNQEEHHRNVTFRDEFMQLLKEHEIEFDEKYLL